MEEDQLSVITQRLRSLSTSTAPQTNNPATQTVLQSPPFSYFHRNYIFPATSHWSSTYTSTTSRAPVLAPYHENRYGLISRRNQVGHVGDQVNKSIAKQQMKIKILAGGMSPAWAMNVVGSKYLQELLEEGDSLVNHHIFHGILFSLFELMMDANGHGLFTMLLNVCNDIQKSEIVLYLGQHGEKLLQAATHPIGAESVKRLIKVMKRCPCLEHVIRVLASAVSVLMLYSNGSSLVKYCVDNLCYGLKLLMFEGMISNFHIVARNSKGCIWLKKFIDELRGDQRAILLNEVINNSAGLSRDPYGNFVVQHAIKLQDPIVVQVICSKIAEDMVELSKIKSGSYVVEECLKSSKGYLLLKKLASITPSELQNIAKDSCGNYVIQTAIKVNEDIVLHDYIKSVIEGIECPWFKQFEQRRAELLRKLRIMYKIRRMKSFVSCN